MEFFHVGQWMSSRCLLETEWEQASIKCSRRKELVIACGLIGWRIFVVFGGASTVDPADPAARSFGVPQRLTKSNQTMKKLLRHLPLIVAVAALPILVGRGCPWPFYTKAAPHQAAPAPIVVASVR
jgi:hypothetical protein